MKKSKGGSVPGECVNQGASLIVLRGEPSYGTVLLLLGKRELAWEELPERPVRVAAVKPPEKPQSVSGENRKPSAKHPWRKPYQPSAASTVASVARRTKE